MFVINYPKSTKIANFLFSSVLFHSFIYLLALRNFIMEVKNLEHWRGNSQDQNISNYLAVVGRENSF